MVSFTTVSVAPFETPTLNSPNFRASNYSTGAAIQFGDAVQRAEFFHKMKAGWHTNLRPATIVHSLTITVPRFTSVSVNGFNTQVQTYYTSKAGDGRTVVFLLDQFFKQQIFKVVVNEINAGRFKTNALNIALLPNTFLFPRTIPAVWASAVFWGSIRFLPILEHRRNRVGYLHLPAGFHPVCSAAFRT